MSKVVNPVREYVNPHSVREGIPWSAFGELTFLVGFAITALMVFVNTADFQGAEADTFNVKYQVYLRLATCGAAGLYGIYFLQSASSRYVMFPGFFLAIYGAICLLSVPFAIDQKYALVSATCLWCALLFIPAAIDNLGNRMFVGALAVGSFLYVAVSWLLYIFVPEIGVNKEFIGDDEFLERMGGLGHPNNLGVYATSSFLLLGVLWRMKVIKFWPVIVWSVVWAATIYLCLSRTSILLAMIGWAGIMFDLVWRKENFGWLTSFAMIAIVTLMFFVATGDAGEFLDKGLQSLSKSGESDELTSATGRSEIWAYGLKEFWRQPLTGYGYGSARFVMDEHSFHCHNIVINALLQTGIVAGLCIFSLLLYLARRFFRGADFFMRAFIPFFLIGGLVESLIYSPAPAIEMAVFFAIIAWKPMNAEVDDAPASTTPA